MTSDEKSKPIIINQEYAPAVPIGDLKPMKPNPRRGDVRLIEESVRALGFYGAIIANRKTGEIIVGNHRWKVAKKLGATTVPVLWVEVDQQTAQRMALADNRTSDMASWDMVELKDIINQLATADLLEGTGFDIGERARQDEEEPDASILPTPIQLIPEREYVVIMCESTNDWDRLRAVLKLRTVRRGGYKPHSPFDDVGIERVISARRFFEFLESRK